MPGTSQPFPKIRVDLSAGKNKEEARNAKMSELREEEQAEKNGSSLL